MMHYHGSGLSLMNHNDDDDIFIISQVIVIYNKFNVFPKWKITSLFYLNSSTKMHESKQYQVNSLKMNNTYITFYQ